MPEQLISGGYPVFETQLPGWGLPIRMRAKDAEQASQLAGILFKVPSDKPITSVPVLESDNETEREG